MWRNHAGTGRIRRIPYLTTATSASHRCRPLSTSIHPPKKAIIIGAGLQGVTTAYNLHRAGVEVTILEQGKEAACYASRANVGMICPPLSQPLNSYATARLAVSSALKAMVGMSIDRRHTHNLLVARHQLKDPAFLSWGLLFLAHCKEKTRHQAACSMYRLALHSARRIKEVVQEMGMEEEVGLQHGGALKLWSRAKDGMEGSEDAFEHAQVLLQGTPLPSFPSSFGLQGRATPSSSSFRPERRRPFLGLENEAEGIAAHPLLRRLPSAEACISLEPALSQASHMLEGGGVFYRDVSTGDSRAFTQGLVKRLQKEGIELRTGVEVIELERKASKEEALLMSSSGRRRRSDRREGEGRVRAVWTAGGERLEADVFVLACGALAPRLLPEVSLPIIAMKGYSLSLPIPPHLHHLAPSRCLILEDHVYVSHLNNNNNNSNDSHTATAINKGKNTRQRQQGSSMTPSILRVGGLAEFVGLDPETDLHRDIDPLNKLMDAVSFALPELTRRAGWLDMDWKQRGAWSGLRPTTPDSLPILGSVPCLASDGDSRRRGRKERRMVGEEEEVVYQEGQHYDACSGSGGSSNLFVNAGHATMGWTLSVGSADMVSALVLGQPQMCPIDPRPFALQRFQWSKVLGRDHDEKEEEAAAGRTKYYLQQGLQQSAAAAAGGGGGGGKGTRS